MGRLNRLIGAILLISGTTIGAGMLALPVTTGLAGFFPSLLIMTAIWLFMMLTAFYFLEVNLKMKGDSNLISMVHKTLGRPGEIVSWMAYLLLLYALTSAYLLGCSQIIEDLLTKVFSISIPFWIGPVATSLFFGTFVYLGTGIVDVLNRVMMIGLIIAYVTLVSLGFMRISPLMLAHLDWHFLLPSVSVVLTTFGYHIIIPTLTTYLEHDKKSLQWAIFIGSLIPFLVYLIWQGLVMGIVPVVGESSLSQAAEKGLQITFFLTSFISNPWMTIAIRVFAFFAIITSLLGVSLSLLDFLADGLKITKTHINKIVLILMSYLPPLLFALFYPRGFILALRYAGILVALLLALLPALMAWSKRYRSKQEASHSDFRVPGGKILLMITILISLFLIGLEVIT